MHWSDHTIWWQVYPLGFTGAPIREPDRTLTHRLPQLIDWLDYLIELGANGLLLGPIHESETHGYDTTNPFELPDSVAKIYRTYQKLIGIRRRHPWLVTARTTMIEVENTRCRYRAQAADDPGAFIEVALDLNGSPSAVIADANNHVLWNQSTDVS